MSINVFTEEEAGIKTLIPEGTIVKAKIETDGRVKTNGDKASTMWKLIVSEGQYKGAEITDFIGLKGKSFYVTRGKNAMMYALDINRKAHTFLPDTSSYGISDYTEFNGMTVIAKVRVKADSMVKDTGETIHFHKNEVESYCTPRENSSTYKYYGAYEAGDQRWQTDALPPLGSNTPANNSAHVMNGETGHLNDEIPM